MGLFEDLQAERADRDDTLERLKQSLGPLLYVRTRI